MWISWFAKVPYVNEYEPRVHFDLVPSNLYFWDVAGDP